MTPDGTRDLVLPAAAQSPRAARDFVAAALDDWGIPDTRDVARLLTSELVTNAVMHARTDVIVSITRDESRRTFRVTVSDGSAAQPRRRRYSPLATTGRGLAMISEAAGAFGVETRQEGKSIWFELPLTSGTWSSSLGGGA